MARMHVEGKNTEAILPAHMEIVQPRQWEIGDDASVLCPHSVIPVRRFLIRNQNEFTFGYQECAGGSKFAPEPAKDRRPLGGSEQTLILRQIMQCLIAEFGRPVLELFYSTAFPSTLGGVRSINAVKHEVDRLTIEPLFDRY